MAALKVCGLIDSLGSGGAQRQFVELMTGLAMRGYEVTVVIYHRLTFFLPHLQEAGISVICAESNTKFGRIFSVRSAIAATRPNVVISFLDVPNVLAEIYKLLSRGQHTLIVSERTHNPNERKLRLLMRMVLHCVANEVVSNSYAQRDHLIGKFSFFPTNISTIHNCVDLHRFVAHRPEPLNKTHNHVRFVVVASFSELKNPIRFVEAFARVVANNLTKDIRCDWYGNQYAKPGELHPTYVSLTSRVAELGLQERFRLRPVTNNIEEVYQDASALCLPSLAEGCANAICEAMACGLPILASRVGDNARLINNRNSGFLFDPTSVESIYLAIQAFCDLTPNERRDLGSRSRESAESLFGREEFLDRWDKLITGR